MSESSRSFSVKLDDILQNRLNYSTDEHHVTFTTLHQTESDRKHRHDSLNLPPDGLVNGYLTVSPPTKNQHHFLWIAFLIGNLYEGSRIDFVLWKIWI